MDWIIASEEGVNAIELLFSRAKANGLFRAVRQIFIRPWNNGSLTLTRAA